MKRLLIIVALFALVFVPFMAQAETIHNTLTGEIDAPKLIGLKQLSPDLYLGVAAQKDVAKNLFFDNFDSIEDDQSYAFYAKVTYYGCWINCPKK